MAPDAVRCEHASGRVNELSQSGESEKRLANSERQRHAKYGACEPRDDQLARKSANGKELARFDQQTLANREARIECGHDEQSTSGASSLSGEPLKTQQLSALERLAKVIPGLGIILALLSSLFLGTAGMLVKLTTSVHGVQVAVLRVGLRPARGELLPVATRAILGGTSITLSYFALKLIPLGDATTIRFSLPIWTLIMSYFFLRESCGLLKVCAVVICIAGVVLIARPDECVYLMHLLAYSLRLESASEFALRRELYHQSRVQEIAYLIVPPPGLIVNASNSLTSWPANGTTNSPPTDHLLVHNTHSSSIAELLQDSQLSTELDLSQQQQQLDQLDQLDQLEAGLQVGQQAHDPLRQFEGCMMALAASICLSISVISLRMCQKTPAEIIIFWLSASSVLVGTAMLLAMNKWSLPNNARDLLYVLLNGLCGAIGQWFMTSSLKVEQSGIIALARTFDIEIAFFYSALLLGEQIRTTSIVGSVCVMAGVVIVVIPRWLSPSASSANSNNSTNSTNSPHSSSGSNCTSNTSLACVRQSRPHEHAGAAIIERSSYAQESCRPGATPEATLAPTPSHELARKV